MKNNYSQHQKRLFPITIATLALGLSACTGGKINEGTSSDTTQNSSSAASSSSAAASSSAPAEIIGNAENGEIAFANQACINCHGDLENNERKIWAGTSPDAIINAVLNTPLMAGYKNSNNNGTTLSDQQLADLAAYIREVVALYNGAQPQPPATAISKPTPLARLTNDEFVASLRDLLSLPQNTPNLDASFTSLPPESNIAGLTSDAAQQPFSEATLSGLSAVADAAISDLIADSPDIISALSCTEIASNDDCIQSYVAKVAQRAYGRSLNTEDTARLSNIITLINSNLATAGLGLESNSSKELKLRTLLSSVLISPEFLFFVEKGVRSENLALGKTAIQSSTDFGGIPARAVDGNRSGIYRELSVTHTTESAQPWWRVDLGATHDINEIIIANRTDGLAENRLIGAKVYIGNTDSTNPSDYTQVATLDNGITQVLSGLGARGRYVLIRHDAELAVLSLAEVEVYSESSTLNLSDGVVGRSLSSHEIGKRLAYFLTGTTPDTQLAAAADSSALLDPQVRAQHVDRLLQSNLLTDNYLTMIAGWFGINPELATQSQVAYVENFIRNWINNNGTFADLYTAAVQVQEAGTSGALNIAQGKPAVQASTDYSGDASRAVDGNRIGIFNRDSVTHTETSNQPWWRVDLGSSQDIGEIIIANRTDGALGERLIGAKVYVGDNPTNNPAGYTEVGTLTADALQTFANLTASGRYVMV